MTSDVDVKVNFWTPQSQIRWVVSLHFSVAVKSWAVRQPWGTKYQLSLSVRLGSETTMPLNKPLCLVTAVQTINVVWHLVRQCITHVGLFAGLSEKRDRGSDRACVHKWTAHPLNRQKPHGRCDVGTIYKHLHKKLVMWVFPKPRWSTCDTISLIIW